MKEAVRPYVIRGSIGSGKSELVKVVAKEMKYDIEEFDMEFDEFSIDSLKKILLKEAPMGIELMFNLNKNKIIIIKHYDQLKTDQLKELFSYILSHRTIPIFLTTTNLSKSFVKTIPKFCHSFLFEDPFISNLTYIYDKYVEKENPTTRITQNSIEIIAKKCNGDIRHFMKTISLATTKKHTTTTSTYQSTTTNATTNTTTNTAANKDQKEKEVSSKDEVYEQRAEISSKSISVKDIEHDIKSAVRNIYNDALKFENKLVLGSIHTNSVVQENYVSFFQQLNKKKKQTKISFNEAKKEESNKEKNKEAKGEAKKEAEDLETISKIADSIAEGNITSDYIFKNQMWDSAEMIDECIIHGTITPLLGIKKDQKIYEKELNKMLDTITYPPNYRPSGESLKFDENIVMAYTLKYIFNIDSDKESLKMYFKSLSIDEGRLRILCRMEDLNFNRYKYLLNNLQTRPNKIDYGATNIYRKK